MGTHFDDKGKIFTDVVKKQQVWVTAQLPNHQLHGVMHIRSEKRLKEEMNNPELFLAFTIVDVFTADGTTLLFKSDFLAVNKSQIVWIVADDDLAQESVK
jgi:hypothetical protein